MAAPSTTTQEALGSIMAQASKPKVQAAPNTDDVSAILRIGTIRYMLENVFNNSTNQDWNNWASKVGRLLQARETIVKAMSVMDTNTEMFNNRLSSKAGIPWNVPMGDNNDSGMMGQMLALLMQGKTEGE